MTLVQGTNSYKKTNKKKFSSSFLDSEEYKTLQRLSSYSSNAINYDLKAAIQRYETRTGRSVTKSDSDIYEEKSHAPHVLVFEDSFHNKSYFVKNIRKNANGAKLFEYSENYRNAITMSNSDAISLIHESRTSMLRSRVSPSWVIENAHVKKVNAIA